MPHDDAEQINQTIIANTSPRYRRLEALENWVAGTQYQGKKSWWDDDVPLWERAPCLVYPVAQIAIQSNTDLVLGEGRFPVITSKPGEDESQDEGGLSEDKSADLDRFIAEHHKVSVFRAHSREAFSAAQGCGTAVAIHGVRNAKPFVESVAAKCSEPEFDADKNVTRIKIQYPYIEEYKDTDGKWRRRVMLFRRVIDATSDTTYLPAKAREDGIEPDFTADQSKTLQHGLGFCPVVWYPFMLGMAAVNVIDGHAIHALVLDEIQGHDIAISQRHRCALFSEPQIYEVGVADSHNPTGTGRVAMVPSHDGSPELRALDEGGRSLKDGSRPGHGYVAGGARPARKKGPGHVWRYPDKDTKVDAVTIGKDALEAQAANASDIRIKLQEALCVVFLDPESIKFAATTSGKALEAIKQKQIDRCDQYRDDLRNRFLIPSVQMQLRIAQRVMAQGKRIDVAGATKVKPILDSFATDG